MEAGEHTAVLLIIPSPLCNVLRDNGVDVAAHIGNTEIAIC